MTFHISSRDTIFHVISSPRGLLGWAIDNSSSAIPSRSSETRAYIAMYAMTQLVSRLKVEQAWSKKQSLSSQISSYVFKCSLLATDTVYDKASQPSTHSSSPSLTSNPELPMRKGEKLEIVIEAQKRLKAKSDSSLQRRRTKIEIAEPQG